MEKLNDDADDNGASSCAAAAQSTTQWSVLPCPSSQSQDSQSHRSVLMIASQSSGAQSPAATLPTAHTHTQSVSCSLDVFSLNLHGQCHLSLSLCQYLSLVVLAIVSSGPRNSFYCLGHFKNVYDDDDLVSLIWSGC